MCIVLTPGCKPWSHWRSFVRAKPGHGSPSPGEKKITPIRLCVKPTNLAQYTREQFIRWIIGDSVLSRRRRFLVPARHKCIHGAT